MPIIDDAAHLAGKAFYGFMTRLGSAVLSVLSAVCAVVSTCLAFLTGITAGFSYGGMVLTCNLIPGSENATRTLFDVAGAFYDSTVNSMKGTYEFLVNIVVGNDLRDTAPDAFKF